MSEETERIRPVGSNVFDQRTRKGITYGYCICGREVKKSVDHTDYICPLCLMKLVWEV